MLSNEIALVNGFIDSHPDEATREIETLASDAALSLLFELPQEKVEIVLASMLPTYAAKLLLAAPMDFYIPYFKTFKARQVTAILAHFPEDARSSVYDALPEHQAKIFQLLLSYPSNVVGAYMHTYIEILPDSIDAAAAIERIKVSTLELESHAIPVVDRRRQLLGITDLQTLLQAPKNTPLKSLVYSGGGLIPSRMSLAAALQHNAWHKSDYVFVHNRDKQVIGILHHVDLRYASGKFLISQSEQGMKSNLEVLGSAFATSLSIVGQYLSEGK